MFWTDASGSFGCTTLKPFSGEWLQHVVQGFAFNKLQADSITLEELITTVLACAACPDPTNISCSAGVSSSQHGDHSFRIGTATATACTGISDALIKIMRCSDNFAYTLYTCTPRHLMESIMVSPAS